MIIDTLIDDHVELKSAVRDFTETLETFYSTSKGATKEILQAIVESDKFIELKNKSK